MASVAQELRACCPNPSCLIDLVGIWTPLFYITSLLPGSTSWAGAAANDPRLSGSLVTPNLLVAGAFVVVSGLMFFLNFRDSL